MALFCFWTRRACSQNAVLGRPLPPGSRVEAHVKRCSDCHEYWNDMRALTADLGRLVHVPHPSHQVAEPIWERVKPSVRAYPSGRLTLVGAGALGMACGLVWWRFAPLHPATSTAKEIAIIREHKAPDGPARPAPPSGPEIVRDQAQKTPDDSVRSSTIPGAERLSAQNGVTMSVVKAHAPRLRNPLRWTHVRGANRSELQARQSRRRPSMANPLRVAYAPERLRASGLMYEAQGDPGLANVAYQAAYEQRPSEETAYDVGRTAEESGDMEQAMNVYAGLLESADSRGRAKKGWTP